MSNLKRFLALTLAMLMVVGAMAVSAKSFTDVASTDSYAEAVDVLSEIGVIAGTSTDEFSPDALVERQQMAMFIARLATAQPSWFAVEAAAVFADQKDPGYNAAIAYASTNGFVKGTDTAKNLFDGTASVTLQEAATMLCRVLGYTTDAMDKAYPMSYLTMADDVGLLAGLDDVVPTAALTRGEVATMLYNAFKAPMATTFLTSNSAGGVLVNVSIPEDLDDAKRLMTTKWKFSTDSDAIVANQKFAFSGYSLTAPSKNNANPVEFDDLGLANFNDFAKYLPTGSTPESLLGVELELTYWKNKLMNVKVVGSKTATINATVSDAGVVTVDGTAYNLDVYPSIDPTLGDNCFAVYGNDNKIYRMNFAADDAAAVKAQFTGITNGFFTMEVINAGLPSQIIVYKPQRIGLVAADGADTDTTIEIGGVNITANTVNAVVGDYVAYTYGGSNLLEVNAVAVKAVNDKIVKINSSGTATLASGAVVPSAATTIPGNEVIALTSANLGAGLNVYKINNTVVKTALYAATTTYTPKSYYKILAVANVQSVNDGFTTTNTYKIQVVNDAGTVSILTVTHINDEELATVAAVDVAAANDLTVATWDDDAATLLVNKLITVDGQKIYTAFKPANFFADPANESIVAVPVELAKVNTNVYTIAAGTNAILADMTKILVLATGDNPDVYKTFHGKTLTSFADAANLTGIQAIVHNNGGVLEVVYYNATSAVNSADLLTTTPATALPTMYLFEKYDSIAALSITYVGFNLATGAQELVVYNNAADVTTVPVAVGTGAASLIYQAGGNTPAAYAPVVNAVATKLHASGYLVADGNLYTTVGTKYYSWDAVNAKFIPATITADTAAFASTIVVENGNAKYVIVR